MAIQLGSAYGKVSLDVKGLVNGVKQGKDSLTSLNESAKLLGAQMKDVGQKMTVGLTLPLLALGAASVKMASDMVETKSKVKVVFGEMSDFVMDWSRNSSTAMQLSQQEALEAAGTFGNLFIAMKIGKKDAAEMSTTLVQLAADLGSINNIDPSVVLVKLKSGIVGETEAVRDLGIDLRATVVEAKAAEMGFQKLNGQFSQGDLIAARYAIILEQTKVAQGDIARTGKELSGQMRELNAKWKDALAILGQNLLPIVLKFVTWLNHMLEAFNKLSPTQQKLILGFLAFVAVLGPLLILFGTLIPLLKLGHVHTFSWGGSILSLIFGFAKLVAAATIVVNVLEFFGIATGAAGAGVLALNTAIVGVGASVLAVVGPILLVIGVIALLYYAWKKNLFGIQDLVAKSAAGYKQAWGRFTAWWKENTKSSGEEVHASMIKSTEGISASFVKMGVDIRNAWQRFTTWLGSAVSGIASWISRSFSNINWGTVGQNILVGLANGLLLGLPNLLTIVTNIATQVLDQIKDALGISSPSRKAMQLGMFTAQGFQMGLQKVSPEDMARSLVRPITNANSSQQQIINMNIANGVTMHQVRSAIAENNEQLMSTMIGALSG